MGDDARQVVYSSAAKFRLAKQYSATTESHGGTPSKHCKPQDFHNPENTERPSQLKVHVLNCLVKQPSQTYSDYYVSKVFRERVNKSSPFMKHLSASFKILKEFAEPPAPLHIEPLEMPQHQRYLNKKTLIFDLDQTLIHATKTPTTVCDLRVPMVFPTGETINAGINIRPYAMEMLQNLSQLFEIIVFTASYQCYADPILDALDPQKNLFSYRLYREHCIEIQKDTFAKDLRIIPRSLSQMVLIDNSPVSYVFQPENGIPVVSYLSSNDNELRQLEAYLQRLTYLVDVKNMNSRTFKLSKYREFQSVEQLVSQLYSSN